LAKRIGAQGGGFGAIAAEQSMRGAEVVGFGVAPAAVRSGLFDGEGFGGPQALRGKQVELTQGRGDGGVACRMIAVVGVLRRIAFVGVVEIGCFWRG